MFVLGPHKTKKDAPMKSILKNLIVIMGMLVLFTHTASAQWVQVAGQRVYALAISGSNIFAGSDGLFLSTNNGTTWTAVDPGLAYVTSLAVSGSNIFAGTNGNGVYLSTNNGTTWTAVNSGLTTGLAMRFTSFAVSGSNIFAGGDGFFLSTNNGTTWTAVNSWPFMDNFTSLAVSGSNTFAGTNGNGVYLSTNNGTTWTAVNSGLTNGLTIGLAMYVTSLAISGSNIFAGTQGGVFLSTNNGTSWTAVNSGITTGFAVSGSNIFAGTDDGVFLSTNNGATWAAVDSGLTNTSSSIQCHYTCMQITSLAVSGSNIIAGTNGNGVFFSNNNGTSWTAVNSGLTNTTGLTILAMYVYSLAVSGSDIFAGTDDGVWRRPLSEMLGVINDPQRAKANSYTGGFKINIGKNRLAVSLPNTLTNGMLTIGLFTVAGKRIYWAAHRAYKGILNIPVSGISTGMYLMSIEGNNTSLTSSFLVTK
jgi:hypothetical protein